MKLFVAFMLSFAIATSAIAEDEYFGEFLDALKGAFITDAKPRPKFKLETEFRFKDPNGLLWVAPAQKEVDGASIPQAFWSFIGGPFEGQYINASVIHDHYCDTKSRTAHDTHRAFYYGMKSARVPEWKAKFMYWAVATFGPNWKLERRVVFKSVCSAAPLQTTCAQIPEMVETLAVGSVVDLEDPEVLAAALSKAHSVARSLRTSEGRILDASNSGTVIATLDNIAGSSEQYKEVFVAKTFVTDPAQLGVLSQWQTASGTEIPVWENHRVPKMSDAVILTTGNVPAIEMGKQFRVNKQGQYLLRERLNLEALGTTAVLE